MPWSSLPGKILILDFLPEWSPMPSKYIGFDKVYKVIKILGLVNCTVDFISQPKVINGCSDLFVEYFGKEKGVHARSAMGVYILPNNIPVEIEAILELK